MQMIGLHRWRARAASIVLFASGCVSAAEGDGDGPSNLPDRASFPLVVDALERRCATLDCHGSTARNLRLYTGSGLRLDSMAVPGSAPTTEAEYEASYRSVVGLEPEIMSAVVSAQGDEPERLTLLRKARGREYHTAGAVLRPGDPADRCVTSWLASAIDKEACELGAEVAPPSGGPGTGP
jgi:hypothetical protein